ncbi:MAG: YkgJ family cysteine cluster protein, partial [Candidatus Bathyarchaeia archaeon]
MQLMFTCSRCGKCCEMTEMELSEEDVERLIQAYNERELEH